MIESPEQLFTEHRGSLRAAARRFFRKEEDVEDCVQEGMVRIVRFWQNSDPEKRLAWACMIVRNVAKDILRMKRCRPDTENSPPLEPWMAPLQDSHEAATVAKLTLVAAMKRLIPRERVATVLWLKGYRKFEKSTIKVHQYAARKHLRKALCS